MADLRKGRSFVVERGHTVLYGWSPEIFPVVAELIKANQSGKGSRQGACITVLAENDKFEMEDEIRAGVDKIGGESMSRESPIVRPRVLSQPAALR